MTRLLYLDGWRGLAVLAVLVGHFGPWSGFGALGVELFFVLSGRLMAEILFVQRHPLPDFFKRRIARVFPGLLAFVIITFPVAAVAYSVGLIRKPIAGWIDAAGALTFTNNYIIVLFDRSSVFNHTWSLAVEEHSYVLLAAIALTTARSCGHSTFFMLGVAAACMVNGLFQAQSYSGPAPLTHGVFWRTDVRLASVFLAGAMYLMLRSRPLPAWIPVVALSLGCAIFLTGPVPVKYTIGTALFALAIATLDRAPANLHASLSVRPLTYTGLLSYSLYLWQQPFYVVKHQLGAPMALTGAILIAVASYYLVEQPARKWINRRSGPNPERPNATDAAVSR